MSILLANAMTRPPKPKPVQTSFVLPANGKASPDAIARKRRMAEQLMASGMDSSPIASPWQGVSRVAQAMLGGYNRRRADRQEQEGQQSATEAMKKALMGGDKMALLEAAQNPFVSSGGQQMIGDQWKQMNAPPPQRTRLVTGQEAAQLGLDPRGAYNMDPDGKISKIGGGETNVTVNNGGEVGTIPQGFELFTDPKTGGRSMRPITGGPEDKSAAEAVKNERKGVSTALVLDEIAAAKELIEGDSLLSPRTGLTGKLLSNLDNTAAGALKNRLTTIKANIGFDRLQAMREASPTGGALGPVSDFENRLLQAVMGSLEQAQTADQLKYNLERLERIYDQIVNRGIPDDQARQMYKEIVTGQGTAPQTGLATTGDGEVFETEPPPDMDPELWQHMTPEEKRLWAN